MIYLTNCHKMRKERRKSFDIKGVFNENEQGDVMDAFLTHACNEISNMGKNLLQMAINFKSITAKREFKSYSEQFFKSLSCFPPTNTTFSMLLQTFSSLGVSDLPKAVNTLDIFFPRIFGSEPKIEKQQHSILKFYPALSQELDHLGLFVGFISEVSYASLLYSILDNTTFLDENTCEKILNRIFEISNSPALTSFQHSVIILALNKYIDVMKRITQLSFSVFSKIFKAKFPTKKSAPQYITIYIKSVSGITFAEHNYAEIKSCMDLIPKLMTLYINNGEVIDSICTSLYPIITHMKNIQTGQFLSRLEARAQKCLTDKTAWASTLKLIGVIHYLNPLPVNANYIKFLERFVFKRLVKPHKIDAALDYIIATLNPSELGYNWSPQTNDYIKLIYSKVFSVSLRGHELKAATILESIAALDLPTFINTYIPELLTNSGQYGAVVMITFQRILNPLSNFQEYAKAIPTNAATGIHRHIQLILNILKDFISKKFNDVQYENSNFCLNLTNINNIMQDIDLPSNLEKMKTEPLPVNVLYYLLNWRDYLPYSPLDSDTKSNIENATKTCSLLMEQWMTTFDTPHTSFGDLMECDKTSILEEIPFSESMDMNILPLIPVLLHYNTNIEDILLPLFTLMISNDAYIAALSSLIFQLIFYTFPNSYNLLLSELCSFIQRITAISIYPLHHIIQTYYYCLSIAKGNYSYIDAKNLTGVGLIAFTALCSPFPETHIIGFQLIETSKILSHLVPGAADAPSLANVLDEKTTIIEQKMIVMILSEYSTWSESQCPVHRMPTISLKNAALSRYQLLWRFALNQITCEMMEYPLIHYLLILRKSYLKMGKVLNDVSSMTKYDISLISNIFTFLFATSTATPERCDPKYSKLWMKQAETINELIDKSTKCATQMDSDELKTFSFIFTSLNIVALAKAIISFLNTLQLKSIKLARKESTLSVFATMLRHVAMQSAFDDYAAQMAATKQIDEILSIFDTSLKIFVNIDGVEHYRQLFHHLEQFSHFLVFRGQYFRFLHQSKLEASHCPIPRCAQTFNVQDSEISPRCSIQDLFWLLFKWSLIDISNNSDLEAAIILEQNPPSKQQLAGFAHAARVALSFMVPIKTIFTDNKFMTDDFINKCAIIAKKRPTFLKHLLSKQLSLLLIAYTEKALKSDLETGTLFFNSITAQFIPTIVQDSMIYSHNTFIKNMSTTTPGKLTNFDVEFIQLIYRETGTLLLLDLLYLMHSDVSVRQNAMRMLGQIFPVICLFHNNGDTELAAPFMAFISKMVNTVSTQNMTLRIENAVELSKQCSIAFRYVTEQFLSRAFIALPSSPLNRRACSREQLLMIIQPWLSEVVFDLKTRTIMQNPCRFFVYFSPYSFVNDLIMCNLHVSPYTSLLPLWQNLIEYSHSPEANAKYLTITLIDIATYKPETRKLITFILTYIYRLQPQTVNILVNLLNYSSWYFYNVQLCKYEEIYDMNDFLVQNKKKEKIDKKEDVYNESVKFALQSLKELAKEDILPFIDEFNVIISFCLTHIHMKDAFDLLSAVASGLNDSFSAGSPECLWNLCELLARINSVQFDVLRFVPSDSDTPLRALQKRIVSISDLLSLFIKIYGFIPTNSEDEDNLQDYFLLWGLSCGDLQTAATALNLYSSAYTLTEDISICHLLESICIVIRCFVESDMSVQTVEHVSDYVCSVFRSISTTIKKDNSTSSIELLLLPICLLSLDGPLCNKIVNDALSLIVTIISSGIFDKKSKNTITESVINNFINECGIPLIDLKDVLMNMMMKCKSTSHIIDFMMQIPRIPKKLLSNDSDFSLYAVALAPFMCTAIEDPLSFTKFCDFSVFSESVSRMASLFPDTELAGLFDQFSRGHISNPQRFASDLIKFIKQISDETIFISAAKIYSTSVMWSPQLSVNCIYDLCAGIMTFCPNANNFYSLINFTSEATINQYLGDFPRKVAFLQAITNFSETNQISIMPEDAKKTDLFNIDFIKFFTYVQENMSSQLHNAIKNKNDLIQIRFDNIQKFPPMFPLENGFKSSKIIEDVASLCRQVQVNPQTNWALSVYMSQDFTEDKADVDESPPLDYSVNYESLIEGIIESIQPDMEEVHEEKHEQKEKIEKSEELAPDTNCDEIFLMKSDAFLPPESLLDDIVSMVVNQEMAKAH